jgi:3-hydroxyacyl-[acyl-carrier-protein] dehydratase
VTATACSPIEGAVTIVESSASAARIALAVDPGEPAFAGHYPGFAIFPGVCVLEFVRLGALATIPDPGRGWALAEVASARFTGPVFPGDELTADLRWKPSGAAWDCTAAVATQRGPAAKIKVRFLAEPA